MNCNCPRSSYGIKHTSECYDALAAELTDASHELVTSVAALATAMARAKALEADRDQISLTLDVAKADRDKWFNRAKALEAALREARPAIEHWGSHDLYDRVYALLNPPQSKTPGKQLPLCDACDDTGIYNEPQDSMHLEKKPVPCPFCYASKNKKPIRGWTCAQCGTWNAIVGLPCGQCQSRKASESDREITK